MATPPHAKQILLLAFSSTISMVMGITSIMPMVPLIAREYGVSQPEASLVLTMFTMPGIVFALPAGILADRLGRKAVLVPSLLLFSLAGFGCAFAEDFQTLLVLRFFQGMGATSLGILNTIIIADTWSGKDMTRLVGYNMTVLSVSSAVYPALGGALAYFDSSWPFFLPLLVLPVAVVAMATPLAKPSHAVSFGKYLSAFGHAFQNRKTLALLAMTAVTFMMLYGPIITCFPVLADSRFGENSAVIGGAMVFSSFGTALMASQLGRLSSRFSPRNLLLASQALYALALIFLPMAPGIAWTLLPLLLYGMGQGLNIPNVQSQLLQAAPPEQRGSIMSVNGMLLRLGQTAAPVSFSFIVTGYGISMGFYAGLALAAVLSLLCLIFMPKT